MSSPMLLDKRQERIRRMFGQIAPWYDLLNHTLSLNIDRLWRRRTVQAVPLDENDPTPMLDLCTGTGDLAIAYSKAANSQAPIVAADFCHEMLLGMQTKVAKRRLSQRIAILEADAQNLPFADDTFQLVTVAFGLRNISDYQAGLAEMIRVVKPGGKVAILEFSRPNGPISGRAYRWYFRTLLPRIGQVVSRNKESAYQYLPESVMSFPDGDDLVQVMRQHGLVDVSFQPYTVRIASLYVGSKPLPKR